MTDYIRGKDLNLYFSINGQYLPAAHATDCSLKLTNEIQETTTRNTLKGKTFDYTGKYAYTLELTGISNLLDAASFVYFQQAMLTSSKLLFIFTDNLSVSYAGTVLLIGLDISSPFSAISAFTGQLQGDGELAINTQNVPPLPGQPLVTIADQFGNVIAQVPAPGQYNVLRFDTIDCGNSMPFVSQLVIIAGQ